MPCFVLACVRGAGWCLRLRSALAHCVVSNATAWLPDGWLAPAHGVVYAQHIKTLMLAKLAEAYPSHFAKLKARRFSLAVWLSPCSDLRGVVFPQAGLSIGGETKGSDAAGLAAGDSKTKAGAERKADSAFPAAAAAAAADCKRDASARSDDASSSVHAAALTEAGNLSLREELTRLRAENGALRLQLAVAASAGGKGTPIGKRVGGGNAAAAARPLTEAERRADASRSAFRLLCALLVVVAAVAVAVMRAYRIPVFEELWS